jgi:hypothetical protein
LRRARGAETVLGSRVQEALGTVAHADPVDQLETGESVEGAEAEPHASVGSVHLSVTGEER